MKLYHGSKVIVDKPLVSYGRDNLDFDIIEGDIANDKVFNTVELFFQNLIDKKTALSRLQYEKTNNQICFINQNVMDNVMHFESSYKLKGNN